VDYEGAARLLNTTVAALKSRVSRGDNKLAAAMVTNGRSVRFSVAKLTERFTPRGRL
jgi:DNA-directed RNA polymerase specialized sigma24 family protein